MIEEKNKIIEELSKLRLFSNGENQEGIMIRDQKKIYDLVKRARSLIRNKEYGNDTRRKRMFRHLPKASIKR